MLLELGMVEASRIGPVSVFGAVPVFDVLVVDVLLAEHSAAATNITEFEIQ